MGFAYVWGLVIKLQYAIECGNQFIKCSLLKNFALIGGYEKNLFRVKKILPGYQTLNYKKDKAVQSLISYPKCASFSNSKDLFLKNKFEISCQKA